MCAGVVCGGGPGFVAGGTQVVVVADQALVPPATKIALKDECHLGSYFGQK